MTNTALAPTNPGEALAAILGDADRMRDIDVEKMERLFALSREFAKDVAKREFAEAFNRLQGRLQPVLKASKNDQTGSPYAKLEAVTAMLDPLLHDEGFSRSLSTTDSPTEGLIRFTLTLRHNGGHSEQHYLDAPIDDKGIKGTTNKTRLWGIGSSMSYCERYLLVNVCGVQCVMNLDDDGKRGSTVGPGSERITEDQLLDLEAKITEKGIGPGGRAKLLTWLGVTDLKDLPAGKMRAAADALERKR